VKIGLFPGTLGGGGAERVMLILAKGLAERGMHVTVYVINRTGEYVKEIPENVRLVDYNAKFGAKSIIHRVRKTLKQDQLDVVITTLPFISIIVAIASIGLQKRPKLIYREASTPSKDAKNDWRRKILLRLITRFDLIVAVSNAAKSDILTTFKVPRSFVKVIYSPVVDENIVIKSKEAVNHKWLSEEKVCIISVGRVIPSKRYDTLIDAFRLIRNEVDARLLILGERNENSSCYKKLMAQIDNLQLNHSIEFLGFDNNPFKYLSKAKVFVLSSEYEGLPGVLIQAMACGCQVVSTDCPSGPREILEDGKYGRLVQVGNAVELAEAILETIKNPISKGKLVQRAGFFSVNNGVDHYLECIDQITAHEKLLKETCQNE
jgi:glycosyltransferase involved in cell wall biosynthesis